MWEALWEGLWEGFSDTASRLSRVLLTLPKSLQPTPRKPRSDCVTTEATPTPASAALEGAYFPSLGRVPPRPTLTRHAQCSSSVLLCFSALH